METLQRKKEKRTLPLKEEMLLFRDFGSRSEERFERSSQVPIKHWRLSSPVELHGHFISLTFDLFKKF